MKRYQVQYQRGSGGVTSTTVTASSAAQAKQQILARFKGDVKVISVVEK